MTSAGISQNFKPDIISVMPGVVIFVALATHVSVLLFFALVLAKTLLKGSTATRVVMSVSIIAGTVLGLMQ